MIRRPRESGRTGFDFRFHRGSFCRSSHTHTSDFNLGIPVATLPGACRCRVSAGTNWQGISILHLGE